MLNNLCGFAHTIGEIRMTSDGSPWRPITHIEDICEAMLCALDGAARTPSPARPSTSAPTAENYRIREIAEIVAATFPGCALTVGDSGGDTRSYRVSFAKIRDHMPEFRTRWTAERGARQLKAVFERIGLTPEMFEAPPFTRLKELKFLRDTHQIDEALYWTRMAPVPEALRNGDSPHDLTRRRLLASLLSAAAVLPFVRAPARPGGAGLREGFYMVNGWILTAADVEALGLEARPRASPEAARRSAEQRRQRRPVHVRPGRVLLRDRGHRQRPADGEERVVPAEAALGAGGVGMGDLVGDVGVVLEASGSRARSPRARRACGPLPRRDRSPASGRSSGSRGGCR